MSSIEEKIASDVQSPWDGNGWHRSTYMLEIPTGVKQTKAAQREKASVHAEARHYHRIDAEADQYPRHKIPVYDIHHHSLCHIIRKSATGNLAAHDYHYHGYEETWTPPYPGLSSERVFGEVWTSDAFLQAERDLLSSPPEGACTLPRAIWPVMVWSDARQRRGLYTSTTAVNRSIPVVVQVPPITSHTYPLYVIFQSPWSDGLMNPVAASDIQGDTRESRSRSKTSTARTLPPRAFPRSMATNTR